MGRPVIDIACTSLVKALRKRLGSRKPHDQAEEDCGCTVTNLPVLAVFRGESGLIPRRLPSRRPGSQRLSRRCERLPDGR
jgi:hypothetical protein